ncbi:GRB2-associated-binding protein 2 [Sciurus carolinensis]|uniref:GRB2-associated-binding protein 2 n=1 Tax=Sciurus carolinensis TaxID=30640 RepID=A0AA41MRN1_SCICA|nr:GRB2-associated-binding protein 2 [Sciurus carolinensis]
MPGIVATTIIPTIQKAEAGGLQTPGQPVQPCPQKNYVEKTLKYYVNFLPLLTSSSGIQAWRKHWFILQSGQEGSEPGDLEYYKHGQSKKPLWIISLDLCEQVQENMTFHKKGWPCGFVFKIKTNNHTFYLVAETNEDMYNWVQSICQVCGFPQEMDSTEETDAGHLNEAGPDDKYRPMSTLPSILLAMERAGGNAQNIHNPRNPGSPHFVPPTCSPAALSLHKDLVRGSEIQPPAVDYSLKPGH